MLEKVNVKWEKSDNQKELFTSSHTRFDCKLEYNGLEFFFNYQCNLQFSEPTKQELMHSIVSDIEAYECCKISNNDFDNMDEFTKEFGYTNIKEVITAYQGCKRASEELHKIFTNEELEEIRKELEELGF